MLRRRHFGLIILFLATRLFGQDDLWTDEDWDDAGDAGSWSGFVEAGAGYRLSSDRLFTNKATLQDLRWRIERDWRPGSLTVSLKSDLRYDGIEERFDADLRELTAAFKIGESIDARVGQQVLTWGTGDLLFLNDLFPKDFVSFFAGRPDDYLKAPSATLRLTRYADAFNLDVAWTPLFAPDVYLDGERFSFFSPLTGTNIRPQPPFNAKEPSRSLSNSELALRLFRTVQGREYALYAYRGFFKQPTALTAELQPTFAPLTALGASMRRPLGPGLANMEFAYYRSGDDTNGTDPRIPNDQLRLLAGYEWEARASFTIGLQYYAEWVRDHDELLANSLAAEFEVDEWRHVLTNRLTYRLDRDRHTLSLFTFYSPSDRDFYLRPNYTYRHSDRWSFTIAANLFGGDKKETFFNQLRDASNTYLRLRYHY